MLVVTALAACCCEGPEPLVEHQISVSVRKPEVENGKGSTFVSVKTEGKWTLSLEFEEGTDAWASLSAISGTGERNDVILSYEANAALKKRSLTIKARCGSNESECTVTQAAGDHRPVPPADEDPENPEDPEPPAEEPEDPENPEDPEPPAEDPEDPENPEDPEPPAEDPEDPENPEDPEPPAEDPEDPENPEDPEPPAEDPEDPENPEDPEPPAEDPEDPENPDPEDPEPEDPEEPENPDSNSPAVDESWLELPSGMDGYLINTLYASGERNYTHLYDPDTYTSLWTAYPLNSSHMGSNKRPGSWSYNPEIDTDLQADLCSGSYSGEYSRGHMIPNGSRNGNREMQLQTFYVTNSVPQRQDRFNGTIWNYLENAVQSVASSEEIYVITGVTFNKVGESKTIKYTTPNKNSSQKCGIPNYFYKAVLKVNKSGSTVTSASTIGFWFEHKDYDKGDSYENYSVSVDQLEEWLGYDLFVNLPDNVEAQAETNKSWSSFRSF